MVHASKGEGIAFLRQATGATATVFAGDDTTDEDALARLLPGDLGVKVGLDFTQAQFRVEAPVHVCRAAGGPAAGAETRPRRADSTAHCRARSWPNHM